MLTFMDLDAWKESRVLYKAVYRAVEKLPSTENYGLSSQLRRASISISANIAEGQGRGTRKDYIHFLYNDRGSAYEVESHLIACADLNLMDRETLTRLYKQTVKVIRLVNALIRSLKRASSSTTKEIASTYGVSCDYVTNEDIENWEKCIDTNPYIANSKP